MLCVFHGAKVDSFSEEFKRENRANHFQAASVGLHCNWLAANGFKKIIDNQNNRNFLTLFLMWQK
jgi:hypothetical protein